MFKLILYVIIIFSYLENVNLSQSVEQPKPNWDDKKADVSFHFSQTSFKNWVEGGANSIIVNGKGQLEANFWNGRTPEKYGDIYWDNKLQFALGFSSIDTGYNNFAKGDDKLELSSNFSWNPGFKSYFVMKYLYHSTRLNLKTQMLNGYNIPNDSIPVSKFFSPAYLNIGTGFELRIKNNEVSKFSIAIYPLNIKSTLVLDKSLSDSGAFGVDPGKKMKNQFGGSIEYNYEQHFLDYFIFSSNFLATDNYSNKPMNFDVDWENSLGMEIKLIDEILFLNPKVTLNIKYDEDTPVMILNNSSRIFSYAPRTQLKENFEFGIKFKFPVGK